MREQPPARGCARMRACESKALSSLSMVTLTFVEVEACELALVLAEQAAGVEQSHEVKMGQTIAQLALQLAQTAVQPHVQLGARSNRQTNGSEYVNAWNGSNARRPRRGELQRAGAESGPAGCARRHRCRTL